MDAHQFAAALADLVAEYAREGGLAEDVGGVVRTCSFEERGLLTRDAGFVVRLADGSEYQVGVVRGRS